MRGTCKRCGQPCSQGVYFVVSDAQTGKCLSTYDVCHACMEQHSPLIIPAEARQPGVSQVRIAYSPFGGK
jgi:hypothetical protein